MDDNQTEAGLNICRLECHGSKEPCFIVTTIDGGELTQSDCYRKRNKSVDSTLPDEVRNAMHWDSDFGWLIRKDEHENQTD